MTKIVTPRFRAAMYRCCESRDEYLNDDFEEFLRGTPYHHEESFGILSIIDDRLEVATLYEGYVLLLGPLDHIDVVSYEAFKNYFQEIP